MAAEHLKTITHAAQIHQTEGGGFTVKITPTIPQENPWPAFQRIIDSSALTEPERVELSRLFGVTPTAVKK